MKHNLISDELGLPPRVVGELSRRLDASEGISGRVDVERVLQKIQSVPTNRKSNKYLWQYISLAASIVIVIAGIKYLPNNRPPTPDTRSYTTYSTTNGQRANVTLADGSRVTLAPATTLKITGRNVELSGEAVFTVTQHSGDPFTVTSGHTITRVLGTTFGIRAYDANIRIAVSQGKISISDAVSPGGAKSICPGRSPGSGCALNAGDMAEISPTHTTISRHTDISAMLSWTSGRLTFHSTPLRDAIPDLNRWYDVDIRLSDPLLGSRALLGPMPAASPAELAYTLGRVLDVKVVRNGRIITIYP